jgi:hypothetical protein
MGEKVVLQSSDFQQPVQNNENDTSETVNRIKRKTVIEGNVIDFIASDIQVFQK